MSENTKNLELEEVNDLQSLAKWLKQEFPDKMVMDAMSEFTRGQMAGAQTLANILIEKIEE
jgi:hypothetical protein